MSPSPGKRAPEHIQKIVQAVLERNAMKSVTLAPPNAYNRVEEMANGRTVVATVRRFLIDFWTDLETAKPDPDCRGSFDHLCEMKPRVGMRKQMYVKFGLQIDSDNSAASRIVILRFHAAIDSDPIDRIPEKE